MFRVFDYLQYQSKGGERMMIFPWKKTIMVNIGHGSFLYSQTVKGQHSGVKHLSNRTWSFQGDRNLQIHEDNNLELVQGILIPHKCSGSWESSTCKLETSNCSVFHHVFPKLKFYVITPH